MGVNERIKMLNMKCGKQRMPKNVIKLTDWLYITCDKHCWMIMEVCDGGDKPLLYAGTLKDILHVAVNHMISVPSSVKELEKKLDKIHKLIEENVEEIKPLEMMK